MKLCNKCNLTLPLTSFYKRADAYKDSYRPHCKPCCNKSNAKWAAQNKERMQELQRQWEARHPGYRTEKGRVWRSVHRDKINALQRAANKLRRPIIAFYAALRRARKRRATPRWLTQDHKAQIKQIYLTCPPGHHVDHIVPLKGRTVSGLHVPWNLQHLPAELNVRKSNKLSA